MQKLSDEEIRSYTENGKGLNCVWAMAECAAWLTAELDCGTCQWVYHECTGQPWPGTGGGSGHGCTAH